MGKALLSKGKGPGSFSYTDTTTAESCQPRPREPWEKMCRSSGAYTDTTTAEQFELLPCADRVRVDMVGIVCAM